MFNVVVPPPEGGIWVVKLHALPRIKTVVVESVEDVAEETQRIGRISHLGEFRYEFFFLNQLCLQTVDELIGRLDHITRLSVGDAYLCVELLYLVPHVLADHGVNKMIFLKRFEQLDQFLGPAWASLAIVSRKALGCGECRGTKLDDSKLPQRFQRAGDLFVVILVSENLGETFGFKKGLRSGLLWSSYRSIKLGERNELMRKLLSSDLGSETFHLLVELWFLNGPLLGDIEVLQHSKDGSPGVFEICFHSFFTR